MITKKGRLITREFQVLFFLTLFIIGNSFGGSFSICVGQTKKRKANVSVQRQKKKASSASKTKTSSLFEGALLYRNEEYHSAAEKKFSYGAAFNGERTISVIVKGQAIHINDETLHLHTIVNPSDDIVYLFSDLTRKGVKGSLKQMEQYVRMLSPDYNVPGLDPQPITSTLLLSKEKAIYDGESHGVYKGEIMRGDNNRLSAEMWIWDRYKITKNFDYMFYGIPVPGIVRRGVYSQIISVPLIGKMKSVTALELVAYSNYKVKPSEMLPSADYQFEVLSDNKAVSRLYKENRSHLKKLKLMPKSKSKRKTIRNIREKWDFVDDWLRKKVSTENNTIAWKTIGNSILDLTNALSGDRQNGESDIDAVRKGRVAGSNSLQGDSYQNETLSNRNSYNRDNRGVLRGDPESRGIDIDDPSIDPNLRARYKKIQAELKKNYRRQDQVRILISDRLHDVIKTESSTKNYKKHKEELASLKSRQKELHNQLSDVVKEIKNGTKLKDSELAERKEEQDRFKKEEEQKAKEDSEIFFRMNEGSKLSDEYLDCLLEIKGIKNQTDFKNFTIEERRNRVIKNQKRMKEIRKRYQENSGGYEISSYNKELEKWDPTFKELLY